MSDEIPSIPPQERSLHASPMKRYAFLFWASCEKQGYDLRLPEFREKSLAHVVQKTDVSYTTAEHWFQDYQRMTVAVNINIDENVRQYAATQAKLAMEARK